MHERVGSFVFVYAIASLIGGDANAQVLTPIEDFGDNPGELLMFDYVPEELPAHAPLVVALHGCTQTASDYDDETGWIDLADEFGFAMVFPEQRRGVTFADCFDWYLPTDNQRDIGEPASIFAMVVSMFDRYALDPDRVFITGFSGGAAMSSVMLATYPEVFSAGALIAGIPYDCARSFEEGLACLQDPGDVTGREWTERVLAATDYDGPWPQVTVWQGRDDTTVGPRNARAISKQWRGVHGARFKIRFRSGRGETTTRWFDRKGRLAVERIMLRGVGHGVPIDPQDGCGIEGVFAFDLGICASRRIAQTWGIMPPERGH
ncbi:MAG: PHB depolymerase family esterase [Myxococcota bacterium]